VDSITQLALGAAVGEAVLGRKVGHKAILWGAVCGTLPDLDVFIPLGDAVSDFTYHRGPSHSLFVLAALTPLIVWLITRFHPQTSGRRLGWYALVYLCFATHVLLDSFTTYGTQILWPLDNTPIAWSTIFIVDPMYTLPLLAGVLSALVMSRNTPRGHRTNALGLVLSSCYLAWSVAAKLQVDRMAHESLSEQGIEHQSFMSMPTPLNTLLWRVVAMDEQGYHVGYLTLLQDGKDIEFTRYYSNPTLLSDLEGHWPVKRLQWFTKGFYSAHERNRDIVMTDLRMGLEPNDYVFSFKVGEISNPHVIARPGERIVTQWRWERLLQVWQRF
jgi:inner membrane protein